MGYQTLKGNVERRIAAMQVAGFGLGARAVALEALRGDGYGRAADLVAEATDVSDLFDLVVRLERLAATLGVADWRTLFGADLDVTVALPGSPEERLEIDRWVSKATSPETPLSRARRAAGWGVHSEQIDALIGAERAAAAEAGERQAKLRQLREEQAALEALEAARRGELEARLGPKAAAVAVVELDEIARLEQEIAESRARLEVTR